MTGVGGFGSGSSDSTVFVEQLLNDRRKKNNKMLGMYFGISIISGIIGGIIGVNI